jgi:hypothetical protein
MGISSGFKIEMENDENGLMIKSHAKITGNAGYFWTFGGSCADLPKKDDFWIRYDTDGASFLEK